MADVVDEQRADIPIVLLCDDPVLREELALSLEGARDLYVATTSLENSGNASVVVAAGESLLRLAGSAAPEAGTGRAVVAVAVGDLIASARAALAAGAAEIILWPEEQSRLPGAARAAAGRGPPEASLPGYAVAVAGARGGTSATTFTACLCRALVALGVTPLLVDLDPSGGQRLFAPEPPHPGPLGSGPLGSGALGSGPLGSGPLGSGPRRTAVLPAGPLDPGMLRAAVAPHAAGVEALYRGHESDPREVAAAARVLAPPVVCDVGQAFPPWDDDAGRVLLLVPADMAGIHGAARFLEQVPDPMVAVVTGPFEALPPREVARALVVEPFTVFRRDRRSAAAVDLGRLPPERAPIARAAAGIAVHLAAAWGEPPSPGGRPAEGGRRRKVPPPPQGMGRRDAVSGERRR